MNAVNRNHPTKRIGKLTLLIIATFFSTLTFAQVESLSSEIFAQYGKDAFWEVTVTCANIDKSRVIQRNADWSGDWCGKAVTNVCAEGKQDAADKVCSNDYTIQLDQIEQVERAEKERQAEIDRQKAEQERVARQKRQQQQRAEQQRKQSTANNLSIEEQKISIELELLELRRKELELQRRATEIEEQLNQ